MASNPNLIELIEKAGKEIGSEYKLAKALGMPQQNLSGWKSGKRTCTPEDRARLAGFAREDALQEFIRATLEKTAGTVRGEQLQRLLGKLPRQTGEVSVTVLLSLVSLALGAMKFDAIRLAALDVLRCILC